MTEPRPVVGFAGLTHLGIVSAVASAAKGFRTLGHHPDASLVERLAGGAFPIREPGLEALADAHRDRLSFGADPAELASCDIVFLSPDVPTDDAGTSDLAPVEALLAAILPHLAPRALLVALCQVPPGFTRRIGFDPARRFYLVETLIFGRAVERATRPERFILGTDDPGRPLPASLAAYLGAFGCPVLPMRYESAELAKISINLCLVAAVSTANMMADLAARVGADWSEIVPALRLDRRIGPFAYINPGLGLSGGNLERDLANVCRMGEETGAETGVARAFLADSDHRRDWMLRAVAAALAEIAVPAPRIGLLGLAYKEDTASIKNAAAVALVAALPHLGFAAYDPQVPPDAVPGVERRASAEAAIEGADLLVVATPWASFRTLEPAALAAAMRGRVVIDPWRMLDAGACARAGLVHRTLGRA